MNDAEVKLQVKIDDSTASKSVDTLSKKTDNLAKSFTKAGKTLTAGLTVPIVALGTLAVKNASDLQETMNKVDVAFGDSADEVATWGNTTIKQFGIAKGTALDMAALFGDMATGMGMNTTEASKLSTNLTGLAGDLASFKNISIDIAKTALAGVFTGETESLKKLGIIMTQTNLEQYALSQGITKNMDDMTEAEKIQLRYAFVVDRSKNAVGDFARTNDSTANQTRMASETFKELSATFGELLLPIVNQVLEKINTFLSYLMNLDTNTKTVILAVAGFLAVLGPLLMIIGAIIPAITGIGTVIAFLTSPVGLIVLAIGALIGVFVYLMATSEEFRVAMMNIFNFVWGFISPVINNIMLLFNGLMSIIKGFVMIISGLLTGDMKSVVNGFGNIFKGIGNIIISVLNGAINTINKFIKIALMPLNALISGINKIPGVNIPKLKISIPNIPALSVGTNFVAQEGLAYLHQGEAVVPKKYNPAIGGGNGNMNNQVYVNVEVQQDKFGNYTNTIKTFSNGSKNSYNYGAS